MPKVYLSEEERKNARLRRLILGYVSDEDSPSVTILAEELGEDRSTLYRHIKDVQKLSIKELRHLITRLNIPMEEFAKTL